MRNSVPATVGLTEPLRGGNGENIDSTDLNNKIIEAARFKDQDARARDRSVAVILRISGECGFLQFLRIVLVSLSAIGIILPSLGSKSCDDTPQILRTINTSVVPDHPGSFYCPMYSLTTSGSSTGVSTAAVCEIPSACPGLPLEISNCDTCFTNVTLLPAYKAASTNMATQNTVNVNVTLCGGDNAIFTLCSQFASFEGETYLRLYSGTTLVASGDGSLSCAEAAYSPPTPAACSTYSLHQGCYSSYSCSGQVEVIGVSGIAYQSLQLLSSSGNVLGTSNPSSSCGSCAYLNYTIPEEQMSCSSYSVRLACTNAFTCSGYLFVSGFLPEVPEDCETNKSETINNTVACGNASEVVYKNTTNMLTDCFTTTTPCLTAIIAAVVCLVTYCLLFWANDIHEWVLNKIVLLETTSMESSVELERKFLVLNDTGVPEIDGKKAYFWCRNAEEVLVKELVNSYIRNRARLAVDSKYRYYMYDYKLYNDAEEKKETERSRMRSKFYIMRCVLNVLDIITGTPFVPTLLMLNTIASLLYLFAGCDFKYLPEFPPFFLIVNATMIVSLTIKILSSIWYFDTVEAQKDVERHIVEYKPEAQKDESFTGAERQGNRAEESSPIGNFRPRGPFDHYDRYDRDRERSRSLI